MGALILSVLALLLAALAAGLAFGRGAGFGLTLVAAVALLATMGVFVLVTDRQNRRILAWRLDELPSDWARVRATWEISHGVRAALDLLGAGLLALALRVG